MSWILCLDRRWIQKNHIESLSFWQKLHFWISTKLCYHHDFAKLTTHLNISVKQCSTNMNTKHNTDSDMFKPIVIWEKKLIKCNHICDGVMSMSDTNMSSIWSVRAAEVIHTLPTFRNMNKSILYRTDLTL